MLFIRIGRKNVELRFAEDAEPLDNKWAKHSLESDSEWKKFADQSIKKVEGPLYRITGLNETPMREHIAASEEFESHKRTVFKGTTFGRSFNVFSAYAMLLKVGLPDGVVIPNHVIFTWTNRDLEKYVEKIRARVH